MQNILRQLTPLAPVPGWPAAPGTRYTAPIVDNRGLGMRNLIGGGVEDGRVEDGGLSVLQEHSLASLLQTELERLIFEGKLKVGDRLNESTLAAHFKTSRGPLREAMRALGEIGLVSFERNRGAFVREVSLEEAEDLYDLRAALDDEVGRKVASRLTEAQFKALEQLVKSMDTDIKRNDIKSYYQNNLRFHDLLLDYAGNKQLTEVYRRVIKGLHLFRLRGLYSDGAAELSNAEHGLILKAVQVGDAESAGHAMRGHIEAARLRMRRAVSAAKSSVRQSPLKVV